MKKIFQLTAVVALLGAGILSVQRAQSGGDQPFPLLGEGENIQLKEVWAAVDNSKVLRLYKSESGETFLVLETARPRKVELLRRVK